MSTAIEKASLQEVVKNLNKEIKGIKGRSLKGMIEGVIEVRRDMDKTSPLIPVGETGNLRQSWFVTTSKGTTPQGKSPNFKGRNAEKMASEHSTVKTVVVGRAQAKSQKGPVVAFGFSANYAVYVHEMYGAHFRRPGAGAGFFVASIKRNKGKILNAIKENAKVR